MNDKEFQERKWGVIIKKYKTNFLWPHKKESIEEAGYEFANGSTEEYQKLWWNILIKRIKELQEKKDENNI